MSWQTIDWYDTPRYYDLIFDADTRKEADFLVAALEQYGRSKGKRVLEPACGSGRLVLELARRQLLKSAHDISDGGFGVCLAEACIAHGRGARVSLPSSEDAPAHALLFSEEPSRIVASLSSGNVGEVTEICARYQVPFETIGRVEGSTLAIDGVCEVSVEELTESHTTALDSIVS